MSKEAPRPSYTIFSPLQDMIFVLFTPLLILGTFAAARLGGWMDGLIAFGLALAVAHYLPGILRAYGDRELFRRFRFRLIIAPLFLITITTWFAYRDLHIVILLQMLWGGWHWAMQVYGFARIYDAKAPANARTPALLDRMMCVTWFGVCVLSTDPSPYVTTFYESGGPLLHASSLAGFTQAWFWLTAVVTLGYASHTLSGIRGGRWPNPLKLVFIAVTFLYLWHTASMIEQPVVGLVMFESWHDIQYLAIVWLFNINRTRKGPDAGPVIRFLFRPRAILVLVYLGLCLAFGTLNHAWRLFENQTAVRLAISLVTATALLHYYLDGFIWRIRENETRRALGVGVEGEQERTIVERRGRHSLVPAWGGHALFWLLFLIPAAVFFVMESRAKSYDLRIREQVIETLPNSARAHYDLGKALQEMGRLREGKVHFERALALAPDMLTPHISLGMLLADQGNLAGARAHLETAVMMDPKNGEAQNNLAVVLVEQGDLPRARVHLEQAVSLNPRHALFQNNLGRVLAQLGDLGQARVYHERAVRIDPNLADAQYQLGVTMAKQGDLAGAVEHLQQALRIDPAQYLAHNALGGVLLNMGKLSEAKLHFERALEINPDFVSAQQNLAGIMQDRSSDSNRSH